MAIIESMDVPVASRRGAEEIIERAAQLSERDVVRLAKAARRACGYLHLRKKWGQAMRSSKDLILSSNRVEEVEQAEADGFFALIRALTSSAERKGHDTSAVAAAVQLYRISLEVRNNQQDHETSLTGLRVELRNVAGRRVSARLGHAALGVGNATRAALIWDLAQEGHRYGPSDRQVLIDPWLKVAKLPSCLPS